MKAVLNIAINRRHKGAAFIVALIFIALFSTLAISIATMATTNAQLSSNQHKVNCALAATESGIECGRYIISKTLPLLESTGVNYITTKQANTVWATLCQKVEDLALSGQTVPPPQRFCDEYGDGDEIETGQISYGSPNTTFKIRFYRYDSDPRTIRLQSTGADGQVTRKMNIDMAITKNADVLNYAIASRGRMWITGDSTIYGDIFSSWDRASISPFNMTSDSKVIGTINTVLALDQIESNGYQLETLNEDDQPIDANGDPLGSNYDERYYGPTDEIQGYHEGINYEQANENMPGLDISHYNTDAYYNTVTGPGGGGNIPASSKTVREYFPHAAGDYSAPKSDSRTLDRHVYENQTFTNVRLPDNRNALFKNCTFNEILYVDCYKSTSSYYNNVRFDNCTFNGVIVTDVPSQLKWQNNCLYFTGTATFENQSSIQEATILAPHFNVNLGNTNPEQSDNNVLTGAIVGGIVDVRGNAHIKGTIISMCDTTQWTSGYVTNIGATLDDGGSETAEIGDIGVIEIEPDKDKMLPSGITSPIVIKPLQKTYTEQ